MSEAETMCYVAADPTQPGVTTMSKPPVTYPVTLADLELFANAACELDGLQGLIKYNPIERARIADIAQRMHDTVERAAGANAYEIYGADETCIQPEDGTQGGADCATLTESTPPCLTR